MKTILQICVITFISSFIFLKAIMAQDTTSKLNNPAFTNYNNSLQLTLMPSLRGSREDFKSFYYTSLIYSQPNKFMRIPGRFSAEFGAQLTTNKAYSQYKHVSFGLLQEIIIGKPYLYTTGGLGFYIYDSGDDRNSSNFVFGETIGIGSMVGNITFEVFARYFSNGNLRMPNRGENFIGLRVGYLFSTTWF